MCGAVRFKLSGTPLRVGICHCQDISAIWARSSSCPAATVEHASMHTEAAEAAILDVNLNGRRVFPIADELMRRGVPFVFFSGDEDIVIPERLRHASNLRKSSDSFAVFDALFPPERSALAGSPPVNLSDNVFSLLPKLRLVARLLLGGRGGFRPSGRANAGARHRRDRQAAGRRVDRRLAERHHAKCR